jgi:hypothetical protein
MHDPITPETWRSMSPEVAAQTIRGMSGRLKEAMNGNDYPMVQRFLETLATQVDDGKVKVLKAHQLWCCFIECFMVDPKDLEDLQKCQTIAGMCCYEAGISPDYVNQAIGPRTIEPRHFPELFGDQ